MVVIVGKFNYSQEVRYWEVEDGTMGWSQTNPGDYALVHNNKGFDLVEIIGIMISDKKYMKDLGVPYGNVSQKVVMFIPKMYLR